jgi:hypothetical protein
MFSYAGGESAQTLVPIEFLETQSLGLQSAGPQECTNYCDDISCFSSPFGVMVTDSPCDSDSDGDVDGVDLIGLAELLKNTFVFEGGQVQLPNDGSRLLVITMNEEFVGSATYFGYIDGQGEPVVTGFTIDIGEGTCNGSVDGQNRPIELILPNGAIITYSYNADGTFNFTLVNGDTIYSGENIVPIEENPGSTAGISANAGYEPASDEPNFEKPITGREVAVYGKDVLNKSANRLCQDKIDGLVECFASSALTELAEDITDFFLTATFMYVKSRQLRFAHDRIMEIGHCNDIEHPDYNASLCKIREILVQGWLGYHVKFYTVLYYAFKFFSEDLINEPGSNVTYEQLCTCNPVAYTGVGEYTNTIIAKFGNMGRATCQSDAAWSLVLNPDGRVGGIYVILKKANQTTSGDVYCVDLDQPEVITVEGYQSNNQFFWLEGGDFSTDNRFEGSYNLMNMTGSGSYEYINPQWEAYSRHDNVTLYRAECDQNSDCSDGKWCTGFEECFLGTCLEGNPPCEENQICDEEIYKCLDPPAARN